MQTRFEDCTVLTYRAYTRVGLNPDSMLQSVIDRASDSIQRVPKVEKRTIYVPISFSELLKLNDQPNFMVIDYYENKCHVIREWEVVFDGIHLELPIEKGLVSYRLESKATIVESEPL
jgi:hypothetical protein